jgi:hypothetical protein
MLIKNIWILSSNPKTVDCGENVRERVMPLMRARILFQLPELHFVVESRRENEVC